jgi:hypothetical protein
MLGSQLVSPGCGSRFLILQLANRAWLTKDGDTGMYPSVGHVALPQGIKLPDLV